MKEIIESKLNASRKELLDLSLRNTLLNYKTPKARGLQIIQEKSRAIYDILVKQGKSMTFVARPGKDGEEEETDLPPLEEPESEDAYYDTRLQTNLTEKKLQTNILNTYYFAKTSIEEQGVNILYLALGMLNWYEKNTPEETRYAPLILIPVSLERSSASERFRLRYSGADIGPNLSLQAKLMADYSITLPDLAESEEFDVDLYFKEVLDKIKHVEKWRIDEDAIELGFFSFGKFMIYEDLDSSKWPDERKPYNHDLLQALFHGGFKEPQPIAGEEHHLDEDTEADKLFQVVDADSSQVLAMLAVHDGRNMVIQGPPGTGKSQTISNIIANSIGNGKKVLFVAEKMAALEVVKRRLDNIGLGEACLELHSHKANKRTILDELKRILELGKPTITQLEEEINFLPTTVEELNTYCNEINTQIGQSGITTHEAIGHLLKIQKALPGYKFPKVPVEHLQCWDQSKILQAEQTADKIQTRLKAVGLPEKLLFAGTRLSLFLPSDEESLKQLLDKTLEANVALQEKSNTISQFLTTPCPKNEANIQQLIQLSAVASAAPDLRHIQIQDHAWLNNQGDIEELLQTGSRLSKLRSQYADHFIAEAWDQHVLEIRQDLIAHGHKWYKFLIGDYKRSNKKLAGLLNQPMPGDLQAKLSYVDAILEGRRLTNSLQELEPLATRLLGSRYQKLRTNWETISSIAQYLKTVHQGIHEEKIPASFLSFLEQFQEPSISDANAKELAAALASYQEALHALLHKLKFEGNLFENTSYATQHEKLTQWKSRQAEIHQAVSWNVLVEDVETDGYSYMLQMIKSWEAATEYLKTAVQKSWYEYLIEQAMLNSYALRKFERSSHEETIERFRRLDRLNQQYNRIKVALKHWESLPKMDGGGQINVLRNEFNKKARHMPIRKLVQEAGLAIQAIKPVMMMSPMSIANFLSPGSIEFDLVIFDEASQVRPVEALGAILRGKQLIVVGDTKQMPPTSFFDKLNTDVEDEENVTADMQSILSMCDGQGAPQRMLQWHYRSRHESLISLSNQQFYENKLVIFPSPGSKYRMGLAYHHLPDTVYDRGKTRTNPKEAEIVAEAVMQHALHNPKLTLGVVAFSTAQMQAIQDVLEIKRRKNPDAESFFRSHPNEPFFVKNLENVQGDERDVIFISIGYGRVEDGNVPMSFGPLNNEGGERRLNVLITRAKRRCEVFTNITSEDIKVSPTAKLGIRTLKSFLYFAEHGKFESDAEEIQVKQPPFEELVADSLQERGYTVRQKVGTAGFYLDLAVVDPDHPGRYLLGVTCDGHTYQAAKSARDRDRLRKEVLSAMGWKIYQLWSTDWFRNPDKELDQLIRTIEEAKSQTALNDAVEEEVELELASLIREAPEEVIDAVNHYQRASLPPEVARQELHLQPLGRLSQWIGHVVQVEGPVHFEEVARRIADANGVSKIGSRIRAVLEDAVHFAEQGGLVERRSDFLWSAGNSELVIRDRSSLPPNAKKLQFIAPEELHLAIKRVVEESIAIQPDVAVPLIAKLFGFARVMEDMRKQLLDRIDDAVEKGVVIKEGDFLKGK
ncbi:DUF3320 domain-containing protein [Olivibacter jilunii]|uniref:DUF3320 domain-containing protein n=1 Tax=Olivibacter jilunii TaxID=985016 RepID=UPI003F182AC8